ncbi:MAG TPA: thiamine pyrophosphate-dependent enzyme [Synergistales bacterium]|jgi:2-oxoglutarate ferredoxin oxidoreductase subunit beta|nr:thiamine pyrophosphate-dependent enzyme [Synergistaceae bacterium]MDD3917050.1 thiamine pyrophosphate-dependent enzyme [Synergistaceae bacterium]NLD97969.1 2-oxoglutarate oxidoreductase [Synergistaceae bacterium]HPE64615.1 thiamine pyrophosphate-dependent enzyme [Synergistales bacterium]
MSEVKVYERPKSWMPNVSSHYCPGCGHGIAHRLVCEAIDELGIQNDTIGVAPVGCAAMIYDYMDTDYCEAPHGRAPAVATGLKTVRPDKIVYTYQGDGDLASIGMGEIIHAANRGQNITVIFINNAIYGMTGGQMAPTTLIGQRASTCPLGRDVKLNGYPIRVSELLAALPAPGYVTRVTVAQPKYIIKAKQAVKQAFQNQLDGKGFSLVEILSSCPTNWGMRPVEAFDWLVNTMMPYYPLGTFKDFD